MQVTVTSRLDEFLQGVREGGRMRVAVAYLSDHGAKELAWAGYDRLEVIAGLNDGVTDPEALRRLRSLSHVELRLLHGASTARFHPKFYWSERGARNSAYIGSANLTRLGMGDNDELGVHLEFDASRPLAREVDQAWSAWWTRAWAASDAALDAYQRHFNEYEVIRSRAPRLDIASFVIADDCEPTFFAMRARAHGQSGTVLQANARHAHFFGVHGDVTGREIQVAHDDAESRIKVKLNTRATGAVLQLNMGGTAMPGLLKHQPRTSLIVLHRVGPESYRLEVVEDETSRARTIIAATDHRGSRPFASGVGRLGAG